jgi:ribosomal subunit interface protein
MTIQITGKNVDAGSAFQDYVTDKMTAVLGKYIGPDVPGHVRLEKARNMFQTSCSVRLASGLLLEASGDGADAYSSADAALEHLEKRVRRHKRRLKNHHNGRVQLNPSESIARDYTLHLTEDEETGSETDNSHPVVIAETQRSIRELPVSEAVLQLDLADAAFLVFRNASHGGLNVVYRRADGHVGWIDPSAT